MSVPVDFISATDFSKMTAGTRTRAEGGRAEA